MPFKLLGEITYGQIGTIIIALGLIASTGLLFFVMFALLNGRRK